MLKLQKKDTEEFSMQYSTLNELITFLENGTNLHIGVLFFEHFEGEIFSLDSSRRMHTSNVCSFFKSFEGGTQKCYRCRKMAIRKAQTECRDFGGYCVNGVYEYTRPVMVDGKCAAIIFIGNIFHPNGLRGKLTRRIGHASPLLDTMEKSFDEGKCRAMGMLIESYIRALDSIPHLKEGDKSSSKMKNIDHYIEENLEFDIRLSDMAKLFHYNEQYFGRLFKRETGMSFSEYVNYKRVTLAASYLGDDNITNIAFRVGFNSVTYFNRIFKRHFGMTPSEYQKNK